MDAFLSELVRGENLVWTVLLGIILIFWLITLIGFFDIEALDFDFEVDLFGGLLNLGEVPFSIWISIFSLQTFAYSIMANVLIDGMWPGEFTGMSRFFLVAAGIVPLAWIVTRTSMIPLKKVFKGQETISNQDLEGKICEVTSSRVSDNDGFAEIKLNDGAPIRIHIRSRDDSEVLVKGDKALICYYDAETRTYDVTRFDT